ncbi:hypothetical protein NQ318_012533 [Aromia moschata]|uniref:LIM zinc-binding domain-containing protein n=1 Tax=Aromia moschata TaxID=1265417 RepID=A0AAV8X8E9_9CUCU|nr:hypothetical protein NQ318_012533 [Aromia moschata]
MATFCHFRIYHIPDTPYSGQSRTPAPDRLQLAVRASNQGNPVADAPPPKQNLDSMLENLQADMSRQGVNTSQKDAAAPATSRSWARSSPPWERRGTRSTFTCAHCTQELGTRNFFERDGKPYCEPDYHNLFSPRCAYCNGPILDKCVTALEKTWHMDHFFCAQCGKQFGEEDSMSARANLIVATTTSTCSPRNAVLAIAPLWRITFPR